MAIGASQAKSHRSGRKYSIARTLLSLTLICSVQQGQAEEQDMISSLHTRDSNNTIPLTVTNNCVDTIWPAILSVGGIGPDTNGFALAPGENKTVTVSQQWRGRIWARTNCTFPNPAAPQVACGTGDCAGAEQCKVSGLPPHTLAEFVIDGFANAAYYDISMVDGFNLGMAILVKPNGVPELEDSPRNISNPSCVGSLTGYDDRFKPYANQQTFLGTDQSSPLPFALDVSRKQIGSWCPFDLQKDPPEKPGDGVYPYPDDNIQRPIFQPCLSACNKYNRPKDCCTGDYNSPLKCKPGLYSKKAKVVCPDAYSFAYDDQDSTFTTKAGAGFEIVVCPSGRSTKILKTLKGGAMLSSRSTSKATAYGENSTPPWVMLTAAALVVTACVFSSL